MSPVGTGGCTVIRGLVIQVTGINDHVKWTVIDYLKTFILNENYSTHTKYNTYWDLFIYILMLNYRFLFLLTLNGF